MLGIDHYLVQNGPSFGTRLLLIRAGDLQLELLPDRGFDIGRVWFEGSQIAWTLPSGFGSPPPMSQANDWISSFGGGLLTTCGPENFGSSSEVEGFPFSLHGSFTNLRFELLSAEQNDEHVILKAKAEYAHLSGDSWEIVRVVTVSKANRIQVFDSLKNTGYQEQPVLVLFHVNLGGQLLSDTLEIESPHKVHRYSDDPGYEDSWSSFGAPNLVNKETVYLHNSSKPIWVRAMNQDTGITVGVSSDSLCNLFQWKFRRKDRFALGLEPATSNTLEGRMKAIDLAPKIAPETSWNHILTIEVSRT